MAGLSYRAGVETTPNFREFSAFLENVSHSKKLVEVTFFRTLRTNPSFSGPANSSPNKGYFVSVVLLNLKGRCFLTGKPCLEVLPHSILQTQLSGHCLGAL